MALTDTKIDAIWQAAFVPSCLRALAVLCLCAFPVLAQPGPMVAREPITLPAAIAAGQKEIVVTGDGHPLEHTVVITGAVRCEDNVTIECHFTEPKPCIELRDGGSIENCTIVADWQGAERQPNWRTFHGVAVYGHQARIENCRIMGFDDNIYAGPATLHDRTPAHVIIRNVSLRTGFRNGISVVSGIVLAENLLIENTFGASPQAGIDIEPAHPQDTVQVSINRLRSTANKGSAILVNLDRVAAESPPPRIALESAEVGDTTVQHQEARLSHVFQENGLPLEKLPKGTLIQINGIAYVKRPQ